MTGSRSVFTCSVCVCQGKSPLKDLKNQTNQEEKGVVFLPCSSMRIVPEAEENQLNFLILLRRLLAALAIFFFF